MTKMSGNLDQLSAMTHESPRDFKQSRGRSEAIMKFRSFLIALALGASASAPAAAQNGTDSARCFLVANLFAAEGAEEDKAPAVQASIFYLGRLTGTPAQLETQFSSLVRSITAATSAPLMQACLNEMSRRANDVKAIGERLRRVESR
jgi:hypothetical protein